MKSWTAARQTGHCRSDLPAPAPAPSPPLAQFAHTQKCLQGSTKMDLGASRQMQQRLLELAAPARASSAHLAIICDCRLVISSFVVFSLPNTASRSAEMLANSVKLSPPVSPLWEETGPEKRLAQSLTVNSLSWLA